MRQKRLKIIILLYIFCFIFLDGFGQSISSAELKMMKVLNSASNAVPEDLLLSKSIVIISMGDGESTVRGDWKTLSEEAHFYIKKLSIDAVLYFYIDDIIAGYDVQRAIAQQMIDRDIKNILMLSKDKINGRDQFISVLTPFNKEPTFMSNNQAAWKSQTSDLEILFRNLSRSIDNADLTLENLLIIDSPEYYRGSDIIRGGRFETLNTDLRIDKLAVPKFVDLPTTEDLSVASSTEMVSLINSENTKNLQRNAQLEQLMVNYPYQYEIIPYEYDEKKLLTKGFQFVLMRINSSGRNVRKLLGYGVGENNDELITVKKDYLGEVSVKSIPMDAMVFKYYIKHLNSGDVYLGEQWDGDDIWQDALNNHMSSIIEKLETR